MNLCWRIYGIIMRFSSSVELACGILIFRFISSGILILIERREHGQMFAFKSQTILLHQKTLTGHEPQD